VFSTSQTAVAFGINGAVFIANSPWQSFLSAPPARLAKPVVIHK
jgi:hypothetical protein